MMPREPRGESGALVLGAPAAREPAPHLRDGPFQRRFRPPERARRIRVEPLLDPDGGRHAGLPQRVLGDTAEEPAFGCMRANVRVRNRRGIDIAADNESGAGDWHSILPAPDDELPDRIPRAALDDGDEAPDDRGVVLLGPEPRMVWLAGIRVLRIAQLDPAAGEDAWIFRTGLRHDEGRPTRLDAQAQRDRIVGGGPGHARSMRQTPPHGLDRRERSVSGSFASSRMNSDTRFACAPAFRSAWTSTARQPCGWKNAGPSGGPNFIGEATRSIC